MESDNETGYILKIPNNTNYWLLRADGGKYLADFEQNNFISIGHNEITMKIINGDDAPRDNLGRTDIKELYAQFNPDDSKQAITLRANQLIEFVYDFKVGDIVIVPGRRSIDYSVGIVAGEPYDLPEENVELRNKNKISNGINYTICPHIKRRKVCWIKSIKRSQLPKELSFALTAQQTVFNVKEAKHGINKIISPVFIDEYGINLVIATDVEHGLTLQQYVSLATFIKSAANDQYNNIRVDPEKNSPTSFTAIISAVDPDTIKAITTLIKTLYQLNNDPINTAITVGSVYTILKLVFGKNIKQVGLIRYFSEMYSNHLDNELKRQEIEKNELELKKERPSIPTDAQSDFLSMNPRLKTIGNEISHDNSFQGEQKKAESNTKLTEPTNSKENIQNQTTKK